MPTPVHGAVEPLGDLDLTSSAFSDGGQMPDSVGYANENESPPLQVSGVPDDAASLVLIMDDPDAEPVVGHVWDHWLVWDIEPETTEIPAGWDGGGATVGYNDYPEADYGGPAPPEGSHTYHFKLFALDTDLGLPPEARKARLGSAIALEAEVLAATELRGTYDADQGTIF